MIPRHPEYRSLRWPDSLLALQEIVATMTLDTPLYIVGGVVRDSFMHRPTKDIDLATAGPAIAIARQITNRLGADIFVMDTEREIARVLWQTDEGVMSIDISRFRGEDLYADLVGRDFTINAMAVDLMGDLDDLIDPLNGSSDVVDKVIRRCTPQSIADDPIRALRAVRQSFKLGFKIHPDTQQDIREQAPRLADASVERIRDEFFNILSLDYAGAALRVMRNMGLTQPFLPELELLDGLFLPDSSTDNGWQYTIETMKSLQHILLAISYRRSDHTAASFSYGMLAMQFDRFRTQLNEHITFYWPQDRSNHSLMMLAALLHGFKLMKSLPNADELIETIALRLRLSNQEIKRLLLVVQYFDQACDIDYESDRELHHFWYATKSGGIDACLVGVASYLAYWGVLLEHKAWLEQVERSTILLNTYYYRYDEIIDPQLLLDGNDLLSLFNIQRGPMIGHLLDKLRLAQVEKTVQNREDAIQFIHTELSDSALE